MNTLVTGGVGFIGSHLVARLIREGHRVRVIDNLSAGISARLGPLGPSVELLVADIRDEDKLERAVANVEVVFHLAAMVSVGRSVEEPLEAQSVNATGTLQVLEAARRAGVRRVVQASTCAVYGNNERLPLDETAPTQPLSPYAATKLAAEQWGQLYCSLYGLEVVALRFFNVYGPGQDPNSPYAAVVPRFVERMLAAAPVKIFGDGQQSRDFVYVGDVVDALIAAATAPGAGGAVLNVGSGVATTVEALAEALARQLDVQPQIEHAPARPGEVRHSLASTSRLESVTRYRPRTSLDEGLAQITATLMRRGQVVTQE